MCIMLHFEKKLNFFLKIDMRLIYLTRLFVILIEIRTLFYICQLQVG